MTVRMAVAFLLALCAMPLSALSQEREHRGGNTGLALPDTLGGAWDCSLWGRVMLTPSEGGYEGIYDAGENKRGYWHVKIDGSGTWGNSSGHPEYNGTLVIFYDGPTADSPASFWLRSYHDPEGHERNIASCGRPLPESP